MLTDAQELQADNERLKTENANLKTENERLEAENQSLKSHPRQSIAEHTRGSTDTSKKVLRAILSSANQHKGMFFKMLNSAETAASLDLTTGPASSIEACINKIEAAMFPLAEA